MSHNGSPINYKGMGNAMLLSVQKTELEMVNKHHSWLLQESIFLYCLSLIEAQNRDEIQAMPSDAISEILSVGAQGINNQEEV